MKIRDERLREFQEAYKKDFNAEISMEEAREMLSRLVTLYQLLRRPYPEEENSADEEVNEEVNEERAAYAANRSSSHCSRSSWTLR